MVVAGTEAKEAGLRGGDDVMAGFVVGFADNG